MTKMLIDAGYDASAGEIHTSGLNYARNYGVSNCFQFDLLRTPFVKEFDTIGMFDVLEHLDDEKAALDAVSMSLKPQGKLILTVPAYNFLWNRSDAVAYHKRRYTRKYINELLSANGYKILKTKYFFASLVPLLILRRFINKDDGSPVKKDEHGNEIKQSVILNALLNIVLSVEFLLFKLIPLPFGGSIIVVAEKK